MSLALHSTPVRLQGNAGPTHGACKLTCIALTVPPAIARRSPSPSVPAGYAGSPGARSSASGASACASSGGAGGGATRHSGTGASPDTSPLQPRRLGGGLAHTKGQTGADQQGPASAAQRRRASQEQPLAFAAAPGTPGSTPKLGGATLSRTSHADADAPRRRTAPGAALLGSPADALATASPTMALYGCGGAKGGIADAPGQVRASRAPLATHLAPAPPLPTALFPTPARPLPPPTPKQEDSPTDLLDRSAASPSAVYHARLAGTPFVQAANADVGAAARAPLVDSSPFDLDDMDTHVFRCARKRAGAAAAANTRPLLCRARGRTGGEGGCAEDFAHARRRGAARRVRARAGRTWSGCASTWRPTAAPAPRARLAARPPRPAARPPRPAARPPRPRPRPPRAAARTRYSSRSCA